MSAPKPGDLAVSRLTGRTHRTVLMVDGSYVWLAHGDEATRHPLETFDRRWRVVGATDEKEEDR